MKNIIPQHLYEFAKESDFLSSDNKLTTYTRFVKLSIIEHLEKEYDLYEDESLLSKGSNYIKHSFNNTYGEIVYSKIAVAKNFSENYFIIGLNVNVKYIEIKISMVNPNFTNNYDSLKSFKITKELFSADPIILKEKIEEFVDKYINTVNPFFIAEYYTEDFYQLEDLKNDVKSMLDFYKLKSALITTSSPLKSKNARNVQIPFNILTIKLVGNSTTKNDDDDKIVKDLRLNKSWRLNTGTIFIDFKVVDNNFDKYALIIRNNEVFIGKYLKEVEFDNKADLVPTAVGLIEDYITDYILKQ